MVNVMVRQQLISNVVNSRCGIWLYISSDLGYSHCPLFWVLVLVLKFVQWVKHNMQISEFKKLEFSHKQTAIGVVWFTGMCIWIKRSMKLSNSEGSVKIPPNVYEYDLLSVSEVLFDYFVLKHGTVMVNGWIIKIIYIQKKYHTHFFFGDQ